MKETIILSWVVFVTLGTILLGVWATKKSQSVADFFVAGRNVNVFWNASAISGEYLSAASFMGVAGLIMKNGYDALWYPVGYAAGYLFLLLFIAGPLRRFGAYTIPDFAEGRFHSPAFRKIAVSFVLFIGFFYTMPQMRGAGLTMQGIFPDWPYATGIIIVGAVITFNVVVGGMKGITLVQAVQYWAKVFAISLPCFVVMSVYGLYNKPLAEAAASQKSVPTIPGDKFSIKGKAFAPNNGMAFSSAGTTLVKFESDSKLVAISINPKPKPTDTYSTSLALGVIGSNLDIKPDSKDIAVPKDTLLQITPFDVTSAEGKVTKASLKFEFEEKTDLRLTAPLSEGGQASAPNSPSNEKWLNPFGPLTSKHQYPLLYTYSLIIALVCGTAGLPHILVRFYTNPDGKSAKRTTLWVMVMLGLFYIFTPIWGSLGRMAMPLLYANNATDATILKLPATVGGDFWGAMLSGITSAGAFAAFMSTFSGLLVSMSGAFAHDIYGKIINPTAAPKQRLIAFKLAAIGVGLISVLLGIMVGSFDIAMMVGWAFAIGASSYFPLLLLGAWWRGLTAKGAGVGMVGGGLASLSTIVTTMLIDKKVISLELSPLMRSLAEQPAIWAVPLSLLLMVVVSKATSKDVPEDVDTIMLRLHAPESMGLSKNYIDN